MRTRRPAFFALSFGTLVAVSGCSDPAPPADASVDVPTTDVPTVDAGAMDGGASQLIGPGGGVIFAPGLTFTVPPGALTSPVTITVTRTDAAVPAGYVGYSPVWRFSPEGQVFATPATVDISFSGDHARANLYWSRAAGGYERLDGAVVGDHVVGSVSHFSLGFIGDLLGVDGGTADVPDAPSGPDVPVVPDVPVAPSIAAPRPIAPLTGAHAPSRRPALRWALPAGVTTARVTLCRDRALTVGCTSFDATGTAGTPSADLAAGAWFWALRGVASGVAGAAVSPVWRLRVASATIASARPWGGDPDVNGDGYADVLAAVPDVAASVFVGAAAGPSTTPVVLTAPLDSTHFGQAIDFGGDVDGDGYGDVVVGSPGSNAVYLYRGSATGVVTTPAVITGPVGSGLGSSVAGGGDVNGDGFDDVVAVNPSGNAVWFMAGGTAGLATPVRVTVPLTSTTTVLAGAGDVDGDGFADVLLGGATGDGALLRGGASGLDAARSVAVDHTSAPAGDLNGDGRADLAVFPFGGARVVLGVSPVSASGTPVIGASLGAPTPRGGDFDGDGFDDLLASNAVAAGAGAGLGAAVTLATGFGGASLRGVVGAGDVDGDGFDDLLSHGSGSTDLFLTRGSAAGLVFGRLSHIDLGVLELLPDTPHAAVGDVDHDGHADLASGAAVRRGSATGLLPAVAWTLASSTRVGDVAAAGDVNHDGFMDLVATSDSTFTTAAQASLFLGSAAGPGAGRVLGSLGSFTVEYFQGLAGVGDFNGDGFADVALRGTLYRGASPVPSTLASVALPDNGMTVTAVGAAGDVNGDGRGDVILSTGTGVRVVAGAAAGSGPVLATFTGTAVAAGDVNGDHFADVALATATGTEIHLGSASGSLSAVAVTLPPGTPVGAGDVNHDGRPDLILSLEGGSRAALFLNTGAGFATTPSLLFPDGYISFLGTLPGGGFGDVDGDGFDDVMIRSGGSTLAVQRFDAPGPLPFALTLAGSAVAGTTYR